MSMLEVIHTEESGEFFIELPNDTSFDDSGSQCDVALWPTFFLHRGLWIYLGLITIIVGSVGHLLTVLVILGNAGMRRLPLSVYLFTMSLTGLLTLYASLLPVVVDYLFCFRMSLKNMTTEVGCQFMSTLGHWGLQFHSWTEVLFAIERLIATRWPLKYNALCSSRRNMIIVGCFGGALLLLNTFHFYIYGFDRLGFCEPINTYLYNRVWRYLHLCLTTVGPIVAMTAVNAVTIHTLRKASFPSSAKQRAESSTVMMISLNVLFVLTTLPDMVVEWEELSNVSFEQLEIAGVVCRLLKYAGSACSVIIYVSLGAKFRAALKDLVCRRRQPDRMSQLPSDVTGSTTTSIFVVDELPRA